MDFHHSPSYLPQKYAEKINQNIMDLWDKFLNTVRNYLLKITCIYSFTYAFMHYIHCNATNLEPVR